MTTDGWRFDSLRVMLAFRERAGLAKPPEWTDADADAMERYCTALMQATRQMNAGQRKGKADECGEHVDIAYVETCDEYHAKYCPNCGAEVVE